MRGRMPIGPFDSLLRVPALLECDVEGRRVQAAELTHFAEPDRLAAACEGLAPRDAAVLVSYSCARSAVHHGAAFCEAVEEAQGIEVPGSHGAVRVLLSECTRIASHLEVISDLGMALEDDLVFARPRRYVAGIRGMLRSMCGNPFGFGAVVPGGVDVSLDDGAVDEIGELCRAAGRDCRFWSGKLRMSRARLSSCVLEGTDIPDGHPPAPAFRASGSQADLRAGEDAVGPYSVLGYRAVKREGGTPMDRAAVLLAEVAASSALIDRVSREAREYDAPAEPLQGGKGSSSGDWESPHGALEYRVLIGSEGKVMRVRSFCASGEVARLAEKALRGVPFEDCALALISLNICGRCDGARG